MKKMKPVTDAELDGIIERLCKTGMISAGLNGASGIPEREAQLIAVAVELKERRAMEKKEAEND